MELLVEDEDDCFEAIGKLIAQGINAGDIKKLQDAGIYTCHGLMMPTKKSITGIKRLSEAVDKICEAAGKIIRRSVVKITTGSQVIDELLGGENSVARSGKTQLAHTLCVSTQLPLSMRGGNGKLAVVTEGTFRPDRIVPIAEQCGLDSGAVLDNYNNEKIIFARAYTYEHQYDLLGLAAKLSEEPFGLLIIDLIIAMFRVDFSGRDELAEDQQRLVQMLPRIIKIVEKFNVVVYMTNQGGRLFISDSKKPAGGYVLTRAATVRLLFKKVKGEQRVCKVFDPPNLPESEASGSYGEGFGFDYGAVCDNIIDSASFRNDFSERGELAERQQGDDCFENYMQLMEHVEDEDNCFEAIVQWSGVSILDSKNPARDSALYQEVTRRLTFMGKGEQTFHTKAVMHANHARHGVRTQHGLTGNKGVRKSSYSRNRKRLKRYKTPRKNLPQTKERKKNAVEYSLTPFFLEYRPLSRSCDVYDLAHDMWDTHALPADAMTDNLYSYQPGVMIAVNNAHPDTPMTRRVMLSMSCFLNSWTSLGDLDEIECPYLISRTNRWTTVIGAGMDSRVYDSIHSEPRISANLPLTLAEAQHAHCLQVGPNLFVLSLLHNRFCALKLGAPSNWIQTRTLLPGEDLVMCGYHNEFLILVKWTAQSIQIHRMGLNRNGLPVPGVQFSVANAPPNVVQNIHLERHNHPERKIRMTGDVVFLYERPHLHHFTIGSGAWGHAINEQLPNFWSPNEIPLTIAGYFLPDPAE